MKRLKYCILGLLAAFSLGFYSCQNDDVSDPNKTDNGEQIWTVASSDMTTKSGWSRATIHSGLKTYKTGQTAIIKADLGSTISGNSEHGRGSIGNTYTSGGYACADITNINDNWVVEANFPNYSVTVEAGTGGTASGGGSAIDWGKSCDISATANSGYSFNGWTIKSGSGSFGKSSDAKTTFSPTSDCTVTANFKEEKSYNISISVVSVASGSQGARIDNYTITGPVIRDGSNIGSHSVNETNLPAGTYQVTVGSSFLRDNAWEYPRYVNVTPQNFTLSENNTSQFVLVTISDSPISGDR